MKKYCPKCGSVKVEQRAGKWHCNEPDCLHEGSVTAFGRQQAERDAAYKSSNTHWRDPAKYAEREDWK